MSYDKNRTPEANCFLSRGSIIFIQHRRDVNKERSSLGDTSERCQNVKHENRVEKGYKYTRIEESERSHSSVPYTEWPGLVLPWGAEQG